MRQFFYKILQDEKEGEMMVGKLQPKPRTDLATLYT